MLDLVKRADRPTPRAAAPQVDDQVAQHADQEKARIGNRMRALLTVKADVTHEGVLSEVCRHFPIAQAAVGNLLQFAVIEAKQPIQIIQCTLQSDPCAGAQVAGALGYEF